MQDVRVLRIFGGGNVCVIRGFNIRCVANRNKWLVGSQARWDVDTMLPAALATATHHAHTCDSFQNDEQ